ncbi:hypothetical protein D0Z07_6175 [Hyphodiscus hymeniophilus]|uniref:Uncharacterized protein n=1 Tax=Hyphodiscus hymeniophilus TaxID=353542 RepID=A0A9P7AV45_9HELO|nr:hypothetical protein D0Z07_6175 [Hyphodiscus hymeniophilus]
MPARELGASFEAPNGVGSTLLKRHKTLPHPREERFIDFIPPAPTAKPRALVIDTGTKSVTSSDTSSPRTLKHPSKRLGAPSLPPTPPTHSRQSSGDHPTITSAPRYDASRSQSSAPSTPPNQKSPPTPDFTPPRAIPQLVFRPPPSDRYPSSRNDSFKTARENPYSSDEDDLSTVRPVILSARQSKDTVPHIPEIHVKRREVGLGLGLESDNEGTSTPKGHADSQQEFVVFDGEWGSTEEASEVEREWDDNLMRNVTVRKRPGRNMQMFASATDVLKDDIVSPTNATRVVRSLPLQERIARHRLERDVADRRSTEKFAERIAWPSTVADPESPTTPDVRRFSAMSGKSNSTIVEAMVIDALPSRRKTLRHTKKYIGLREFSSDHSTRSSAQNSSASVDLHRLVHKTSRIPDKRHRSLASNATASTASSSKSRRDIIKSGGIPVVVIPDRRSSTKSSKPPSLRSTSSRRTKRSMSLGSAPLSNSSKFNEPGYFDSTPRKRTLSESAGSGQSVRTIDFPPTIPARRSSLSAPTSRNTSRAGSLTAESLKAHNLIQENRELLKPMIHNPTESRDETANDHLSVDHNGDPLFGTRPSTQVTPFSQASYETAGTTAEVSEAMAVTLFPHQNKSLLVIQHAPDSSPEPLNVDTLPPKMKVNVKGTMGPVTLPQTSHPMDEVDSPLRNPRDPPEPPVGPPAIKFIPPTPAGLTPSQEEHRQLGYNDEPTSQKPKRSMSLMRRAFSNRQNFEPTQKLGFLRTFSLRDRRPGSSSESTQTSKANANLATLYPSVGDQPADGSKLHPFWRPTHFWDDLEDYDSDADDELRYPPIDNRPPPPKRSLSGKLKRTFAILPIKDEDYSVHAIDRRTMRRTENGMRVVKQRSNSSLRRDVDRPRFGAPGPDDFGYGFKDGNGGRIHTIPGLGIRVEYVGWNGIKRRLSERKREQRSDKLRASISTPREVQSGVDDVLRRRSQV